MGLSGDVRRASDQYFIHANIDTDVIVDEEPVFGSKKKPEEIYRIIERFCLGRKRLELFGDSSNTRDGWVTVGKRVGDTNFNRKDYESWFEGPVNYDTYKGGRFIGSTKEIEILRPKSPGRKNKMITGINCGGMEESIGVFRRSFEHNEDRPTMFFMGLLHSFTFIEIEKVEIDGVMQNRFSNNEDLTRIKVLSLLLDKVKDLPNIEAVTFTDLQHMNYKPPMSSYSADPYPEYFRDTKTHGYGWLRKYSASYLEKLEVTNVS